MIKCPHCGKHIRGDGLTDEDSAGIDFLIVYWMHRGFTRKGIANALGRSQTAIMARERKLWRTFGPECNFYLAKRLKNGKTRLDGFFRGGQFFRVALARNETFGECIPSEMCVDYPVGDPDEHPPYMRMELPEDRRVIELDDWVRLGFRVGDGWGVYADSE